MTSKKKPAPAAPTIKPEEAPQAPAPEVEKVECPPELSAAAREEWDRVAPHLVAAGRLKPLDRASLAIYCAAYASWLEATIALQSYGTVMKSPNGYPLQSPYVSIATKNADIMIRIASEFGFTPFSRTKFRSGSTTADSHVLDMLGLGWTDPLLPAR